MTRKMLVWIPLLVVLCTLVVGCGTEQPAQVVSSGFTPSAVCIVPDMVGLTAGAAEGQIVGLGLQPVKSNQYDPGAVEGAVISQDPPAGTRKEPCQGDVTIVVSLGPVPGPTATFTPPPSPTAIPPTATPTPDPRLFWDDFETGIKPEWGMSGRNYAATNGKLVLNDGEWETIIVGNSEWDDYEISLGDWRYSETPTRLQVQVRVQNRDNYMLFKGDGGSGNRMDWRWYRVVDGQEQEIPGTDFRVGWRNTHRLAVEVEGNVYRIFLDGEQKVYFADDTYRSGGVKLLFNGWTEFSGIEVTSLR